jgi:DNA helicase-2/ATP-dependent DNA helicase PcrA
LLQSVKFVTPREEFELIALDRQGPNVVQSIRHEETMTEPTDQISDEAIISQEEISLERVQRELAIHLARPVGRTDFDQELLSLRDQLNESHSEDHAMLVEHMTRLSALRVAQDRDYEAPLDPGNPYFARLVLEDQHLKKKRVREIFIGKRSFIDTRRDVRIVDWRNSPISRIYYCYDEDDEYEERFADEVQSGYVRSRRTLNVHEGRLVRIGAGDLVLVRNEDSGWGRLAASRSKLAGGAGSAIRAPSHRLGQSGPDQRLPEITALIDPVQFRAITEDGQGAVVIHGGAGTGKTTIALHRMAWLFFQDRRRFAPKRMLFITPGQGLKRYVSRVLPALDVPGVPIRTFSEWALQSVKRLVPSLKKRKLTDETPSAARRLKRRPVILKLLETAVKDEARALDQSIQEIGGPTVLDAWVRRRNLPPIQRLAAVSRWLEGPGRREVGARMTAVRRLLERAQRDLGDPFEIWANLLTDKERLRTALKNYGEQFHDWEIDQLVDVVSRQSEDPEDHQGLGEHATGIDGLSISAGDIRGRLDVDDLTIILRVCQLEYGRLSGPSGQHIAYEHLVVDEAQDLSPLAVKVLCDAVQPGGPITLAGDTAQRLYLDGGFDDWEQLIADIGLRARILPPLSITYRSTRQVMSLARHVLGPLLGNTEFGDARDGGSVELMAFDETGQAVAFLADALKSLRNRERKASIALVSRTPSVADLYYTALKRAEVPNLRRIRSQEFDFSPGIDVTDVFQIKGLEYDYVVVLEPTMAHYPDDIESRHLLHVAATRAAHQLWLITSSTPSPLLPQWLLDPAPPETNS